MLGGIDHVALACSDMASTVDFYSGVLVGPVLNHGITLEFACWVEEFTEADTRTPPKTAALGCPPASRSRARDWPTGRGSR